MTPLHDWAIRHGVSAAAIAELPIIFAASAPSGTPGSEAGVQGAIRLAAPRHGGLLWRNNSGAASDEFGRTVRYGLANDSKKLNDVFKSSDLIGITPVTWQGRRFGVFTAVECKEPGWTKPRNDRDRAQANFLMTVESLGGIAMFANSVDTYAQRVTNCYQTGAS